jgi:hypothetical protein
MREPGESYSDVILRIAGREGRKGLIGRAAKERRNHSAHH